MIGRGALGNPFVLNIIKGKICPPSKKEIIDTALLHLELLSAKGYEIEERRISVDEIVEALENGTLEEMWGTGTAAVVSPVGYLSIDGKEYCINNNEIGEVTKALYDELTGIQWGRIEDSHGWITRL